jgi:hypothetical protein
MSPNSGAQSSDRNRQDDVARHRSIEALDHEVAVLARNLKIVLL